MCIRMCDQTENRCVVPKSSQNQTIKEVMVDKNRGEARWMCRVSGNFPELFENFPGDVRELWGITENFHMILCNGKIKFGTRSVPNDSPIMVGLVSFEIQTKTPSKRYRMLKSLNRVLSSDQNC